MKTDIQTSQQWFLNFRFWRVLACTSILTAPIGILRNTLLVIFLISCTAVTSQLEGQDAGSDFRAMSGSRIYRNPKNGTVTGVIIPGYSSGFQRSLEIPASVKTYFLFGRLDPEGELAFVDSSAKALSKLERVGSLEWLIYCGGGSEVHFQQRELARFSKIISALRRLPHAKALMLHDTTIPEGALEKMISLEHIRCIVLIDCSLKNKESISKIPYLIYNTSTEIGVNANK